MKKKSQSGLAVLGTGLMGFAVAERLLSRGREVAVYNRTREKAAPLEAAGARIADSPEAALRESDCAILMLTDAEAVRSVLLSDGAASRLPGITVVQMGTLGPHESRGIAAEVERRGGRYLEAPVLGSLPQARQGELLILAGGEPRDLERHRDVLEILGSIHPVGPVGKASALKLALNQLIAAETAGFSLSLGLVQRAGVSVELFMEILRSSALYAPTFDKKLPLMLSRNFGRPNFPGRHLLKDVELILGEARRGGLQAPALEGVRRLLEETVQKGRGDADYSAIFDTIAPASKG